MINLNRVNGVSGSGWNVSSGTGISDAGQIAGNGTNRPSGDPLYGKYDIPVDAPNLTRVVVQGSTNCPHAYLRLHVDPTSRVVFSEQNVVLPLNPACDGAPALGGF